MEKVILAIFTFIWNHHQSMERLGSCFPKLMEEKGETIKKKEKSVEIKSFLSLQGSLREISAILHEENDNHQRRYFILLQESKKTVRSAMVLLKASRFRKA